MAGVRDLLNLPLRWWSTLGVVPVGTTTGEMRVYPRATGLLRTQSRASGHIKVEPQLTEGVRIRDI